MGNFLNPNKFLFFPMYLIFLYLKLQCCIIFLETQQGIYFILLKSKHSESLDWAEIPWFDSFVS